MLSPRVSASDVDESAVVEVEFTVPDMLTAPFVKMSATLFGVICGRVDITVRVLAVPPALLYFRAGSLCVPLLLHSSERIVSFFGCNISSIHLSVDHSSVTVSMVCRIPAGGRTHAGWCIDPKAGDGRDGCT